GGTGYSPIPSTPHSVGGAYPVGGKSPVDTYNPQLLPVTSIATGYEPIYNESIELYNGVGIPMPRHRMPDGIFHRPPYAGAYRSQPPHSFGPPTIQGYGALPHRGYYPAVYTGPRFRGFGASPDGLGGLVGFG